MPEETKKGRITFAPGLPMQFSEDAEEPVEPLTEYQQTVVHQVGSTIKAYTKAADELLQGKYVAIRDFAPLHLRERGNILVACCEEGIVVRYDQKTEDKKIRTGWFPDGLSKIAPMISQSVVYCHPSKDFISTISTTGTELRLSTVNSSTGDSRDIFTVKIGFDAVLNRPDQLPVPPSKPFCLLSVQNSLELHLIGEFAQEGVNPGSGQQFMTRTPIRLPVGWECIEVFPFFNLADWKPEYAPIWAENDLLASIVMRQFRETEFHTLDPNAVARKRLSKLIKAYKDLLDSNPEREESLQSFLKEHPSLLCPTHTHVWPKLPLGARATDFVFRDAIGDYLLVELEKSTLPLFLKDGHASRELNHARGQISDWKRYLEDNLSTVQRELGLVGISTNPQSLVVIGRSQFLSDENRRKLVTLENESPRTKIVTYDDVLENAKAVIQNLLGPLWDDVIGNTEIYYLPKQ